ncbi:MAG: hydrogenase expression/formation C-terminal domain-containing protein [Chromatiaceae bacterium]|jgi:hydrogenase-1 operon protein HyaF
MPKFPDIPIVEVGPGTQPTAGEEGLEYMSMPSDMATYHQPVLPEPEDAVGVQQGKRVLDQVLQALRRWRRNGPVQVVDLDRLEAEDLDFVNQALGEGEVSVTCDGPSPIRAQESVLAGVWRVQHFDGHGRVVHDAIEIGEVPDIVRSAAFGDADCDLDTACDNNDPAIQNAPALLAELAEKLAAYRTGDAPHTINLTLLPLTESDVLLLGERLGVGPVTILSRGYGNCRIGTTARRNGWWIKYFNSQDALILNTIEVVDIPSVAIAAPEDIADSIERLDEILEMYR